MYACNGKPRPTPERTYPAQDGWIYQHTAERNRDGSERMTRIPHIVRINHVMSKECRYQESATDKRCAGCQHIQKGRP